MADKFPQIMTASTGTAGAINDYVVATINMPRADSATSRGRRSVYELLKVWWYIGIEDGGDQASNHHAYLSTTQNRTSGETSTLATIVEDIERPTTIAPLVVQSALTTSGATEYLRPRCIDLTDDAGNGILVATDRMFIIGGGTNATAASTYVAKILYRIVSVPGLEFVGIIQSQISST